MVAVRPWTLFSGSKSRPGWGGTDPEDPLKILAHGVRQKRTSSLTVLMVSTTGEHSGYFILDDDLVPQPHPMPAALQDNLIAENCEPALCTVMFMGGAGGSLRAGVTQNPIRLTESVQSRHTKVTCGGAESFVRPGGGITIMVDVAKMPDQAFGYVPTPAIVAPLEFTITREDLLRLAGMRIISVPCPIL